MAMVANNWTQRADLIPRQHRGQEDHPQDSQFSMTSGKLEIPTVLQRTVLVALWILTVLVAMLVVPFLVKELNLEGL